MTGRQRAGDPPRVSSPTGTSRQPAGAGPPLRRSARAAPPSAHVRGVLGRGTSAPHTRPRGETKKTTARSSSSASHQNPRAVGRRGSAPLAPVSRFSRAVIILITSCIGSFSSAPTMPTPQASSSKKRCRVRRPWRLHGVRGHGSAPLGGRIPCGWTDQQESRTEYLVGRLGRSQKGSSAVDV